MIVGSVPGKQCFTGLELFVKARSGSLRERERAVGPSASEAVLPQALWVSYYD